MQHLLLQAQYTEFHFYHLQLRIVRVESIETWPTFVWPQYIPKIPLILIWIDFPGNCNYQINHKWLSIEYQAIVV